MAEILVYGPIDSYSSSEIIEKINDATRAGNNADIVVRVNTPGGIPEYGWGIAAKIAEIKNPLKVKVDGKAHSMGAFLCCYAEDTEALDVSEFLIHRAAYPSWIENDPEIFTEAMRGNLDRINKNLRKALETRIDVEKFETMKGVTLDEIFSMKGRKDCFLTAAEAKRCGLISKVIPITPQKKAEIDELLAACSGGHFQAAAVETPNKTKIQMNKAKLLAEHPEVYAEVLNEGVAKEKERCKSWAHFSDLDPEAVKKGIESGKEVSQIEIFEFLQKKANKKELQEIEGGNAPAVSTTAEATEKQAAAPAAGGKQKSKEEIAKEQAEAKAFEAALDASLGLSTKK